MLQRIFVLLAVLLAAAACGKGPAAKKAGGTPAAPLLISAEDVHTVRPNPIASGPTVTGSIQPEARADLRAEVAAVVMKVLRENGETVRKGDLLVRLDDTAFRDSVASAEAAQRAARLAHEQAERQLERMKTLRTSGMASAQALDDAEGRRNAAVSELEAAKARVVLARQQLQRTEVRAPFDGVVSDRRVSAGDTVQVGKELIKVIDPGSMRFEALVSADHVGDVKPGQSVSFRVHGYGEQEFAGKVRRVNPSANPTTRQVELIVDFVGEKQPKLAGLYAEGRIETTSASVLTLPESALVRDGDHAFAWRLQGDKLQKAALALGERDPRSGDFPVKKGLAEGDRVIRYPTSMLKEGQTVQASGMAKSSMAATK